MKYNVYKIKSKRYPNIMYEVDSDNPTFIGELDFTVPSDKRRFIVTGEIHQMVSSPIKVLKETDEGYYVETQNSVYELRRVKASLLV